MTERLVIVAMHPRAHMWDALCEKTYELAPFLEHIESAQLKSRELRADGLVRCEHLWRARANVPALLAHHIDTGLLEWTSRTEWRANEYESRWVIEPRSLKGSALCEGNMRLLAAIGGKATRVELELALVATQPSAGWHAISLTILSTHFRKLVDAASRKLESKTYAVPVSGRGPQQDCADAYRASSLRMPHANAA